MFFCAYFHDFLVYLLEDLLVYYSLQSTARLDIKSVIVWSISFEKQLKFNDLLRHKLLDFRKNARLN